VFDARHGRDREESQAWRRLNPSIRDQSHISLGKNPAQKPLSVLDAARHSPVFGEPLDVHMSVGVFTSQRGMRFADCLRSRTKARDFFEATFLDWNLSEIAALRSRGQREAGTMATSGQVAIIVAQAGVDVDASACVHQLRGEVPSVLLIQQQAGENFTALGQRLRGQIAELVKQNFKLHSATFLAQRGFGLGDVLATADLLRVLTTSMLPLGPGAVYLQPESADPHAQVALRALADALGEQVRGTGVEIVSRASQRLSTRPPVPMPMPEPIAEAVA
jgi:hypothetical protein